MSSGNDLPPDAPASAAPVWNPPRPVGGDEFKSAMSRWTTGVTIVTTADADDRWHGFTASSFTAVSLVPPMVLVCLDRDANCAEAFTTSRWLAVHVLAHGQASLAQRFARKDPDKFAGLEMAETIGIGGIPLLRGALATFECRMTDLVDVGDHVVIIAEVCRTGHSPKPTDKPLIYYRWLFRSLG